MKKLILLLVCAIMAVSATAAAPAMVERAWFYPGIDGFSMGIVGNADNDDVVVLYNTYCDRNGDGDMGLFVTPPSDVMVGDLLPVPEGYTPKFNFPGAPAPANAGTVAYVGKPKSEPLIEINGLEPGTQYFIAIYSRNAAGEYSELPYYTGTSTYLQPYYTSPSYSFPIGYLPYGWYSDSDVKFVDKLFWDETKNMVTHGTKPIQQYAEIPTSTQGTPVEVTLELPMVNVSNPGAVIIFDYNIKTGSGLPYNDWAEDDVLAIRVSTDGGSTWESIKEYTATDHPTQKRDIDYNEIYSSLHDYRDQNIQVQLYWKTSATEGTAMTINEVVISELTGDIMYPAPTGLKADVTTHAADGEVILTWDAVEDIYNRSYLVAYKLADAVDWSYEYPKENSVTLRNLTPGAKYVWKVQVWDDWSEYSEESTFTMPNTGSVNINAAEAETVTVATVEGVVVLRNAERASLNTLPAGFYIVNGQKYMLRK